MRRCGTTSSRTGFTLLELVLVLAIIAIVLMAAAPSLAGFARGRDAINTAGQFAAVARWARAEAIADGVTYRLNIDTSAGKWWLTKDNGDSFVQVDTSYGHEFTVPEGVKIDTDAPKADTGNAQVIEFDPSGRSDPCTIHFTSQRSGTAEVTCDTPADLYHVVTPQGGK